MAMHNLFIKKQGLNIADLVTRDVTTAAAVLRKSRSGVAGLDCRYLTGGAACLAAGAQPFDTYCAVLDLQLGRAGLTNRGYIIERG